MQEVVEQKTINLAVTTGKLSWRLIMSAFRAYINHKKHKQVAGPKKYRGKQSLTGKTRLCLNSTPPSLRSFQR